MYTLNTAHGGVFAAVLQAMEHVKAVQVDLESKLATVEVEADNYIDAMNMLPTFVTTIKVSKGCW
jgi:hypothetical protein